MKAVEVSGRFVKGKEPVAGTISFMPSRGWITEGGTTWAVLAPTVELDELGRFRVLLSRTDTNNLDWEYTLHSPMGQLTFKVETDGPVSLKKLVNKRFA